MNIECILKRSGGSRIELGGLEYHFEPLEDGAHVAAVELEAHIDRLLSIPEAYKLYHGKLNPTGAPAKIGEAVAVAKATELDKPVSALLAGSELLPPQFEIGGNTYTQIDIAQLAFDASGLTSDEWNELDQDERTAKMEIALDELAEAAEKGTPGSAERDALVEQYKAKFGKAPHHKTSVETIKAKLAE